jgi:membrane associated rhomboid family serine protease
MSATPSSEQRDWRAGGIRLLFVLLAVMWISEIVDTLDHHNLDRYGIEPRDTDGLTGIVAAPFLHVSFGHLIGNTIPFVAMGVVIALQGAKRLLAVTAIVALVSGLGTWLVAPANTLHIGASGVVFGFGTYLIARGFFNRDWVQIGVGLIVGAIWGTALLGGLQPREGISWQGHLFGAIGGLLAAWLLARKPGEAVADAKA